MAVSMVASKGASRVVWMDALTVDQMVALRVAWRAASKAARTVDELVALTDVLWAVELVLMPAA